MDPHIEIVSCELVAAVPPLGAEVRSLSDLFPAALRPGHRPMDTENGFVRGLCAEIAENAAGEPEETDEPGGELAGATDPCELLVPRTRVVYATIRYPVSRPAVFRYELNAPARYGTLLYLYTDAYQRMYSLESDPGCVPRMLNRAESDGPFGIWGHYIDDLVYNGSSSVKVYEGGAVCEFEVDS